MVGFECEGVEYIGRGYDNIVVGLIELIEFYFKVDCFVVC